MEIPVTRSGEGEIPLALPLISHWKMGHFYFGDLPQKWVNIQPALTTNAQGVHTVKLTGNSIGSPPLEAARPSQ
jgi:hypothetical protein